MSLINVTGQVSTDPFTTSSISRHYENLEFVKCNPKAMKKNKKPKTRSGRVARLIKMPINVHEVFKALAAAQSKTVSGLYDEIISNYLFKNGFSKGPAEYLLHQGYAKPVSLSLKEEIVVDIKSLAARDSVSENRVMFTAIMRFAKENCLLTD